MNKQHEKKIEHVKGILLVASSQISSLLRTLSFLPSKYNIGIGTYFLPMFTIKFRINLDIIFLKTTTRWLNSFTFGNIIFLIIKVSK